MESIIRTSSVPCSLGCLALWVLMLDPWRAPGQLTFWETHNFLLIISSCCGEPWLPFSWGLGTMSCVMEGPTSSVAWRPSGWWRYGAWTECWASGASLGPVRAVSSGGAQWSYPSDVLISNHMRRYGLWICCVFSPSSPGSPLAVIKPDQCLQDLVGRFHHCREWVVIAILLLCGIFLLGLISWMMVNFAKWFFFFRQSRWS